jgi:hypothetical protein
MSGLCQDCELDSDDSDNNHMINDFNENDYNIINNIIRRREESHILPSNKKNNCLLNTLSFYTKIKPEDIKNNLHLFSCDGNKHKDYYTRCICSHQEKHNDNDNNDNNGNLSYFIIEYNNRDTYFKFAIGKTCFKNIFTNISDEANLKNFFKPPCKYCNNKILRKSDLRPDCCCITCRANYINDVINNLKCEETCRSRNINGIACGKKKAKQKYRPGFFNFCYQHGNLYKGLSNEVIFKHLKI